MSACPIKDLNLKDLQKNTNIVDGVRIINRPLFDKLVNDTKIDHVKKYDIKRKDLPFIPLEKSTNSNPNNTRETRLSNNTYSEFYQVNEPYYKELQKLADEKTNFDLFAEDRNRLYEDELGQDPSLDDARAEEDFRYLMDQKPEDGGITQFCSR